MRDSVRLLEQAIKVADLFVDKGTLVTTVGGNEREPRRARRSGTDAKSPIAVLVNNPGGGLQQLVDAGTGGGRRGVEETLGEQV